MKKGFLVICEGNDCSFKKTNCELLYERMKKEGHKVVKLSFPDYASDSSLFVKMYLSGQFGENPSDVDPYTASVFYAMDRYVSYQTKWRKYYEDGYLVISDRYSHSNFLHQASKFDSEEDKTKYIDWMWDLEFVKNGIPVPDMVVFFDMPFETGQIINRNRANKITGESAKDIHESSSEFMRKSYENGKWVSSKYSWDKISCVKSTSFNSINDGIPDNVKTKEEIHEELYDLLMSRLNSGG